MTQELSPSLQELYLRIDEQIAEYKAKRPPGDRRRTPPWEAKPPEGQKERREAMNDRRGKKRGT